MKMFVKAVDRRTFLLKVKVNVVHFPGILKNDLSLKSKPKCQTLKSDFSASLKIRAAYLNVTPISEINNKRLDLINIFVKI